MDFMTAFDISASGLSADRTRINTISMNLANAKTTRTAGFAVRNQVDGMHVAKRLEQGFNAFLSSGPRKITNINRSSHVRLQMG